MYTPAGWTTPVTKPKEGTRLIMMGGRPYTQAQAATMKDRERDCLNTLDALWKKLTAVQNKQIADELNIKSGYAGKEDGFRWIVRGSNLQRAKTWISKWFAAHRSI